ncbi:centromere protein Q [Melanotaenia boesemani]|uniref:centromere protein Q n=1 Tax=Melanotaenia boesemani TaxID=1250792 RepID=UPI001C03AB90|nr:centromere protein Q [Melanotaenia boesemani]
MKPARGSSRAPSKGPKVKNKKVKEKKQEETPNRDQEHDEVTQQKPAPKRKAQGGSSSVTKKRKAEENWGVMSTSSIKAMENIIDLSILATLALRQREKKESQEHLNTLKNRFLAHCAKLKVPAQKQKMLVFSSQHHQEETKKSAVGKKTLRSLAVDLKAVVSTLERMEEKTVSLQGSCSTLRDELEAEEEKAEQILQITNQTLLKLLPLPPHKDKTPLQFRLRKIIPDSDCEPTARKLGEVLQKPESIRDAKALLLQAHKHAEQLFNPLQSGASSSEGVEPNLSM